MKTVRIAWVAAVICLSARAFAEPLPIWELKDTTNSIRLMGSIHMLRQADYPLPDGMMQALQEADTLIMEIDMSAIDPMETQQILMAMGTAKGRTLEDALGSDVYAEALQLATEVDIPLAMFNQFEPWLAALTISQMRMMQLGFDPTWGIETQFTARATQDGKSLGGLETVEEQLRFMADMDDQTQREMLLQSLDEAIEIETMVAGIVDAWRTGDTPQLEKLLLESFAELPELKDAILVRRNRNWVDQILQMQDDDRDYLIVVGTMHLIGEDSVVAMLEDVGLDSRQLDSDDFD